MIYDGCWLVTFAKSYLWKWFNVISFIHFPYNKRNFNLKHFYALKGGIMFIFSIRSFF